MKYDNTQLLVRNTRIIVILLSVICLLALGAILYFTRMVLLPFALAVFGAFVLNPLITFFEKRKIPSMISVILAIICTFVVLFLVGILVNNSIQSFRVEFPKYEGRFNKMIDGIVDLLNLPPELFSEHSNWATSAQVSAFLEKFSFTGMVSEILTSFSSVLSNLFLVLLFLFFILMGRNQLVKKLKDAFTTETSNQVAHIITRIKQQIEKYIIAKTLISLLTGILVLVVLLLFDVDFAFIWALLAFLLNFIPSIGSMIATIMPLAIASIQFERIMMVVWLGICLMSIQIVIGNFLDPRFVGKSVNLSPVVVLFSLMFWGWLWGIIGMFLSVPIAVMIKIIFENIDELNFIGVLMSDYKS